MRAHIRVSEGGRHRRLHRDVESTPSLTDASRSSLRSPRARTSSCWPSTRASTSTRQPLPPARVADDLDLFARRYGDDPVLHLFGPPLVAWSGTWERPGRHTATSRTAPRPAAGRGHGAAVRRLPTARRFGRGQPLLLGVGRPDDHAQPAHKLADMGRSRPCANGLWIAPVAPGFDARLVGGTSPRCRGATA